MFVRLTKGNAVGRVFAITDYESFRIISKHEESVSAKSKLKDVNGPFYLIWNKPVSYWNTGGNGRGLDWFQKVPKDIVQYLKTKERLFSPFL